MDKLQQFKDLLEDFQATAIFDNTNFEKMNELEGKLIQMFIDELEEQ